MTLQARGQIQAMAKAEGESFELQQKRWTELMNLRQKMSTHNIDPTGVDLAIFNVFNSQKGPMIETMISNGNFLMDSIIELEGFGIDSLNAKTALVKAFVPGSSEAFDANVLRLKELVKMRQQMAQMGISTGCIESTIAGVFGTLRPEVVSEDVVNKSSLPTAKIDEPAEINGSSPAISRRSIVGISQPTDVEAPNEKTLESKDRVACKPDELPSQQIPINRPCSDAEHVHRIGTSIERMDLDACPAATSASSPKVPSVCTSSVSTSSSSLMEASSSTSLVSQLSLKRNAPPNDADMLGSSTNPICVGEEPIPKRPRTAKTVVSRAKDARRKQGWTLPVQYVGTVGLHLMFKHDDTDIQMVFDVATQRLVFHTGPHSLTALYPALALDPDTLIRVTRPIYARSKKQKGLKVRLSWLDAQGQETFLTVVVATKDECRELIAKLKDVTSFAEVASSETEVDKLHEDATWIVHETHNAVGVSETKTSETVWLD